MVERGFDSMGRIEMVGKRLFEVTLRGLELLALAAFFCAVDAVSDDWSIHALAFVSLGLVGIYTSYLAFKATERIFVYQRSQSAALRLAGFAGSGIAMAASIYLSTLLGGAVAEIVLAQVQ